MNDMVILGVAASAKSLAEQNATAIEALKGGMKYKGAVEDYAHLPATGNKAGDVWSTLDDGCEYVWGNVGGTNQWIQLGTAAVEPLTEAEVDAAVGADLITVTVTNGTATGDTAIAGTATVTIVPNEGYILPQSVTVANASYTYNAETGVISLSEATDTVTISAECEILAVATVSGLGSQNPANVTFVKNANFTKAGLGIEDVNKGSDTFVKIPTMYRKINSIADGQITSFTIANRKVDNDYQPYSCFVDESGNLLDYILIGKYWNTYSNSCVSTSAGNPYPMVQSTARTYARARGTGYQLLDWQILKAWQDILVCLKETIDTNSGTAWVYDELGIYWEMTGNNGGCWIDGVMGNSGEWRVTSKPSEYTSLAGLTPPVPTTYKVISYAEPKTTGNTAKLGYDSTYPFFAFANDVSDNSDFTKYYCDRFVYAGSSRPVTLYAGYTGNSNGAFCIAASLVWDSSTGARLCYRPIAS